MTTERINDRTALRFAEEVKSHFGYLKSVGFRCVRADATFVQFESPKIRINVYHGRQSFEIGLEIESVLTPADIYSFSEILSLVDSKLADDYKKYATHTAAGVAAGVSQLAGLFQQCISADVLSDDQIFLRLELQKKKLAAKYALEVELRQARRRAETAWQEKDYVTVVSTLKPLRSALTTVEVGKLEFAKKQCKQ
ncbi:MAG: hypothetical protein P4L87_08370 [Formivibrio sp.]|nr:hypothetical protein [Formivibrio sp.]